MVVYFPPFHADLADERLWRGSDPLHLTRKAWGVLRALLEAHGGLVTKDALAATVWEGTHVGDDSITKAIGELRRVLGDDQRPPRFIATAHGRGYRFVAPLSFQRPSGSAPVAATQPELIGREHELATLRGWVDEARRGQRRIGFVGGDVGIGKSTLVAAFVEAMQAERAPAVYVAAGQCVEQYGGAEPFLPVIAALRRLARSASAAAALRRAAPPWLLAACGLVPASATSSPATRAAVLRTLSEVIETIADQVPLVLVVEDLHWSDPSTLDLVNLLARRNDPARLLLLCTVRGGEALAAGHPSALLLRELRRTNLCGEIILEGFSLPAVERLLIGRLGGGAPPPEAAAYLLRHTGGNPFFLGALIDDLMARGALARTGQQWRLHADEIPAIPRGSWAAVAPRLEQLSDAERMLLETASVVGDRFTAEAVAAGIPTERDSPAHLESVEAACERLAAHDEILRVGTDGAPYAFRHTLYRQALYEGIAPARRRRLHARIGEALAARPGDGSDSATELAQHFARAGDHPQAVRYYAAAADAARARFADREVAANLGAALDHLRRCPPDQERDLRELMLLQQYAAAMLTVNGFDEGAVAAAYHRGHILARRMHVPLLEFGARAGLLFIHLMRAELSAAAAIAAELTAVAPTLPLPECTAAARAATGAIAFSRGDLLTAKRHLEGLRGCFPRRDAMAAFDPAVWHLGILGLVHAALGEIEHARSTAAELLACTGGAPPVDVAAAHVLVAGIAAHLHNAPLALEHADTAASLAVEYDAPMLVSATGHLRGWGMAMTGDVERGIALLGDGDGAVRASGQRLGLAFMAVLRAEACLCAGDCAGAEAAVRAGLEHARATGERYQDAELQRLRAECLRRTGRSDEAATALHAALKIAAAQGARVAELRAAIDAVRLNRSSGLMRSAAKRLAAIAAGFDRGAHLPELLIADGLLRDGTPDPAERQRSAASD